MQAASPSPELAPVTIATLSASRLPDGSSQARLRNAKPILE